MRDDIPSKKLKTCSLSVSVSVENNLKEVCYSIIESDAVYLFIRADAAAAVNSLWCFRTQSIEQ